MEEAWKNWLFELVAKEVALSGLGGVDLGRLAKAGNLSKDQVYAQFPDKGSLMFALVDVISQRHQDFIEKRCGKSADPGERLRCFLVASFDFRDNNQPQASVIMNALLGHEMAIKDWVHEAYEDLFRLMLDDLETEGIIPDQSRLLVSDLTKTLLAIIFLEGCPWLQMDYLSFVNYDRVALSVLDALERRYTARHHESLLQ